MRTVNAFAAPIVGESNGTGATVFYLRLQKLSPIMEPQIDFFWLIAVLGTVFGVNGVYRRVRYARLRRRRNADSRPAVVLDYLSGHLTRL